MKITKRPGRAAFTLIELMAVITIIVILAGLVIGGMSFVTERQAKEKARVQIALLSKALEEYKLDNGSYPASEDSVDGTGQSDELFKALYYDSDNDGQYPPTGSGTGDTDQKIYLADLDPVTNKQGWTSGSASQTTKIVDPWGNEYRYRSAFGDVSVIPTPAFFYGLQPYQELNVEIEPGKTLLIRFLTTGDVDADGNVTVFFELNGAPREVKVVDRRKGAPTGRNTHYPIRSTSNGLVRAMRVAMEHAQIGLAQIDHVNAHGREVRGVASDDAEAVDQGGGGYQRIALGAGIGHMQPGTLPGYGDIYLQNALCEGRQNPGVEPGSQDCTLSGVAAFQVQMGTVLGVPLPLAAALR